MNEGKAAQKGLLLRNINTYTVAGCPRKRAEWSAGPGVSSLDDGPYMTERQASRQNVFKSGYGISQPFGRGIDGKVDTAGKGAKAGQAAVNMRKSAQKHVFFHCFLHFFAFFV